jgi:hypothetical protein
VTDSTADQPQPVAAPAAVPTRPKETIEQTYMRQTRNAVSFIAWIVGIIVVANLILGIIVAKQISDLNNAVSGGGSGVTPNCMSQGGSDPSC